LHFVAAERIAIAVAVRASRAGATVEGILVVFEDAFLIDIVRFNGHKCGLRKAASVLLPAAQRAIASAAGGQYLF
jgi:hypothetical protein